MRVRSSPDYRGRRHFRYETHRGPGARGVRGRIQLGRGHLAARAQRIHRHRARQPLRGLYNDSTYIASVLDSIKGPVVLVGHSYGGAVISSAAADNPRVKSLVYVSALMPDVGESGMSLAARFPSELSTATRSVPYRESGRSGTDLYLKRDKVHQVFAADLPESEANLLGSPSGPSLPPRSPRRPRSRPGSTSRPGHSSAGRTRPSTRIRNASRRSAPVRTRWRSTPLMCP